jgi:hypothetical protein
MGAMTSRKVKAFVLALACCSFAWAGDHPGPDDGARDGVRADRLSTVVVSGWLGKEFGEAVVRGAEGAEGVAYSYREGPYTRVVGRMTLTCRDKAVAGRLYRWASTRRNFRTRKILTIYVVEREGRVVSFFYREGVGRIADSESGCNVKCQFEALKRRHQSTPSSPPQRNPPDKGD